MAQDGCRLVGKTLTISIYYVLHVLVRIFCTRERLKDAHWLVYFQTLPTCEPHWIIRRIEQNKTVSQRNFIQRIHIDFQVAESNNSLLT